MASFEILSIKLPSSLLARALQHVWKNLSELEEEAVKSNKGAFLSKDSPRASEACGADLG